MAVTVAQKDAERLAWRLHAKSPGYRRRISGARRLVDEALALGPAYVAVSGGKDSVAILGLCREAHPGIEAWHIDSGMESPDTIEVLAELQSSHGVRPALPEYRVDQMMELVGGLGYDGPTRLPGEWHWRANDWRRVLIDAPSQRLCEEHGYRVIITGVRGDESRGRAMRMRRYGPIHRRGDGTYHACPLAWCTGLDSLAYCEAHRLPISRIYFGAGADPPERRRTGCLLGDTYIRQGRYAEIRRRHPLVWRALVTRFPALEAFS